MTGIEVLESRDVKEFLEHFDVRIDPMSDVDLFLARLRELDPRYENGIHMRERFELEEDSTKWSLNTQNYIRSAAEFMRMRITSMDGYDLPIETPLFGDIDFAIVLGGANWSNLDRARYAAEAHKNGQARIWTLIISGSIRKLKDKEKEVVHGYAPAAETEYDLCLAAAKIIADEYSIRDVRVHRVENEKAGTPDVFISLFNDIFDDGFGTVAAVTTQIYQLATELDLARVATSYDFEKTMAAGNPSDPVIVAKRTPATYLSEILRTLRAATLAAQAEV